MTPFAAGLALLVQIAIPAPVGYVNDFAHVLDPASVAHMDSVIAEVRAKTGGEIAVVTLPDIGDRAPSDVAVQIGRQWGVGAKGDAGDPKKNLGVVVLVVPRKNHRPGTGQVFIATGRGAEGFLPDSRVGRIRDAMTPFLAQEDYGGGLARAVDLIAQGFAQQFGVTLDGAPSAGTPAEPVGSVKTRFPWIFLLLVIFFLVSRLTRRRRFLFGAFGGRGWGGGGGGGGGWGGGGGGFGGFGGGGGFSGGGAGGRF